MLKRILIVEDDKSIAEIEKDYLEMSGYEVCCAYDGIQGEKMINSGSFNLVILDLMLPGKNGFEILREISDGKNIPVLVISAKGEEIHKVKALNLGADDYLTKPFGMGEFVARVNSHIKIYEKLRDKIKENSVIHVRNLTVDEDARRVFNADNEVVLTQKEYDLLLFLIKNPNRVYTKEQLFERIWGYDALSDVSTITVHVSKLRDKIEENPAKPVFIETVWGAGYRFRV